jgi:putative tryptophan/tyrosine transport system substrate-binding protein
VASSMRASRSAVVHLLTLGALLWAVSAGAQQAGKPGRVGFLGNAAATPNPFAEDLRALGWLEGRNLVLESRWMAGNVDRAPGFAAELVRLSPDVIVAVSPPAVRAVQDATSTIPVVMLAVADPVGMGFVASLARPGGNITGVSSSVPEGFVGKQLELIKEALPKSSRVGLLFNAANPLNYAAAFSGQLAAAAQALKLELTRLEIRTAEDIERAIGTASRERVDVVFVVGDVLTFQQRKRIHDLAAAARLPTFVQTPEYLEGQGLLAYGPSLRDATRLAAVYVDRILKGAKPADLPVEQPREYRLVVNVRAARALGLTMPPSLLGRADQVIE